MELLCLGENKLKQVLHAVVVGNDIEHRNGPMLLITKVSTQLKQEPRTGCGDGGSIEFEEEVLMLEPWDKRKYRVRSERNDAAAGGRAMWIRVVDAKRSATGAWFTYPA